MAAVAEQSGAAIECLADEHGIPFDLVERFVYLSHSVLRMNGMPNLTGAEFMGALTGATEKANVDLITDASVTHLYADDDGRIAGLDIARPDGACERIGCGSLILACNGYGGDPELMRSISATPGIRATRLVPEFNT